MRGLRDSGRVPVVSFSGVDGAGKTTQIERLREYLNDRGLRVRILRFWDDVARLKGLREGAGHKLFKGDKGIGSPEAPINRQDKNVGGWPMTFLRYILYLLDAVSIRLAFKRAVLSEADLIIFDRYTYDELANLDLTRALNSRLCAHDHVPDSETGYQFRAGRGSDSSPRKEAGVSDRIRRQEPSSLYGIEQNVWSVHHHFADGHRSCMP